MMCSWKILTRVLSYAMSSWYQERGNEVEVEVKMTCGKEEVRT